MTVGELLKRMSSSEISDWQVIFELEDEKAEEANKK
jgi:hypothetical protein